VRHRTTTDDAVKIVRGLPSAVKVVVAVVALLTSLYGGVRFVADIEYDKLEKAQQKIGRQEYSRFRDKTEQTIEKLDQRIDELEKKR
jgi:hypothetical protein